MRVWPTRPLFFPIFLIGMSLCFSPELNAQNATSGALIGVVTDESNALVPNAEVGIRDIARGATQLARTDREGVYRFFFLTPSAYTLTVTHTGFREAKRTVSVLLGPAVSVNVSLAIFGLGFQFFNVFNRPNFFMPDGFSSASTFGQIVYTASPPTGVFGRGVSARMIQVKAQLQF